MFFYEEEMSFNMFAVCEFKQLKNNKLCSLCNFLKELLNKNDLMNVCNLAESLPHLHIWSQAAIDTQRESKMRSDPLYHEKVKNTFGLQRLPQAASYWV